MIRVLVVEDSPVVRELLVHILNSDPQIRVIATASDGEEAIRAAERYKPDLITMDITMPKMNGLKATRFIMETNPVPILIVTASLKIKEVQTSFEAMEAGALAILNKPMGMGHLEHEANAKELIQTVKLMSEIKPVRRWARRPLEVRAVKAMPGPPLSKTQKQIHVVAIGASTGGPPVIEAILSGLPEDFPVPVLIVQHMAAGFTTGFVEWLDRTSALPVHIATNGIRILPGQAYVAPDGVQMRVEMDGKISLINDPPEHGLRPSVSYTFRSVTKTFGVNAVGVLLTGMGEDGAKELRLMRDNGAITIAQNKESSVVFGMPRKAVDLDAAMYVLPPNMIVATLIRLANKNQLVEGGSDKDERTSNS